MTDLHDHLASFGPDLTDPEYRERWMVTDDEEAKWAMRQLARAHAEIARIRHEADVEVKRVMAWAEQAERSPQGDAEFFEARLIEYRRLLEANDPKLPQTYKLPTGSLKRAKGRERAVVEDEAAFREWALDNARHLLSVRPSLNDVKALPHPDGRPLLAGEVVPGVRVERGPDSYTVALADIPASEF